MFRLILPMILVAPGIVVPIHADSLAVDVQCRWSYEDWEPCHFVADPVGQSWKLAFNDRKIQFEHDGSGLMRMRVDERSSWDIVLANWNENGALCWGEVCAKGDLPMD